MNSAVLGVTIAAGGFLSAAQYESQSAKQASKHDNKPTAHKRTIMAVRRRGSACLRSTARVATTLRRAFRQG